MTECQICKERNLALGPLGLPFRPADFKNKKALQAHYRMTHWYDVRELPRPNKWESGTRVDNSID